MRPALRFLIGCFQATGATRRDAELAARTALGCMLASGMISKYHLVKWERDDDVHELRGRQVSVAEIEILHHLKRRQVYAIIRRQVNRRKLGMQSILA